MSTFEVRVSGNNFLIEREERLEKHGFVTNVYTEAKNEEDAENKAIDLLRKHEDLKSAVRNQKDDPPEMYADEIVEITNYEEIEPKVQSLIWYSESER